MTAVLDICKRKNIKIITNMGAANPVAAARTTRDVASKLGLKDLRIAAVTGDDVLDQARAADLALDEGYSVNTIGNRVISANAYIGAAPIVEALAAGADVVITGRAADPALFLGPLIHEFGWSMDDWDRLGKGILVGHLLECAGQITGGYFADPGVKDVSGLARLGFPIGEVREDGELVVTKVAGSGGQITAATVKEQLLYEIHDPTRYFQPDVVADFSQVRIEQDGVDRVRVSGGTGTPKTGFLKTSVGYLDSYIGEGEMSYAGTNAVARGRLALDIVRERIALTGVRMTEARFDLIGVNSLHGDTLAASHDPYEIRIRVAARTNTLAEAVRIGNEVETLYTNGPAGGGGARKSAREIIAVASGLLPENVVTLNVTFVDAQA
jgi:hypothetical protein